MKNDNAERITPSEKRRIMKMIKGNIKEPGVRRVSFRPTFRVAMAAAVVVCLSVGIGAAVMKYTPKDSIEYLTKTFASDENEKTASEEALRDFEVKPDAPIVVENENVRLTVSEIFCAGDLIRFRAEFEPLKEGFFVKGAAYSLHTCILDSEDSDGLAACNRPFSNLGAYMEDGKVVFYCTSYLTAEGSKSQPYYFYGLEMFPSDELAVTLDLKVNIPFVETSDSRFIKKNTEGSLIHFDVDNCFNTAYDSMAFSKFSETHYAEYAKLDYSDAVSAADGFSCFPDFFSLEFNQDDLSVMRYSAHLDYFTVSPFGISLGFTKLDYQTKVINMGMGSDSGITLIYEDGSEASPYAISCFMELQDTFSKIVIVPDTAIETEGLVAVRYGDIEFTVS